MGIGNPFALVWLSLLVVLVLLYLYERWQREVEVSSLLLWRHVREDRGSRRLFSPDLLFLLQAALLLFLAGGLLHPFWTRETVTERGTRKILVLDISASMQAREGRVSRFELCRKLARRLIASMRSLDEGMIIAVSTRPQLISGWRRDPGELGRALNRLRPLDTGTNLSLGVDMAMAVREREKNEGEIHVCTDLPPPFPLPQGVVYHRVGTQDDNVALVALRVSQSPFADSHNIRAYVTVKNFSSRSRQSRLTLLLNDRPLATHDLFLPAGEAHSLVVKGFAEPGRLEARLEEEDALDVDNRALVGIGDWGEKRFLLVSDSLSLSREMGAVIHAIPAARLRVVSSRGFSPDLLRQADVAIFHRFIPQEGYQDINSLYIDPPPGHPFFSAGEQVANLTILDWNDQHETLANLGDVEALPFTRARVIPLPPWAEVLVSSRTPSPPAGTMPEVIPLAFAGEREGHRIACLAFDLGEEKILQRDTLTPLLFLLNLLRWLIPVEATTPVQVGTGDSYALGESAPGTDLEVIDPEGRHHPLTAPATVETNRVGEYRVVGKHFSRTLYANLFDEKESDIGRRAEEGAAGGFPPPTPRQVATTVREEFSMAVYTVALVFLTGEWLYVVLRQRHFLKSAKPF